MVPAALTGVPLQVQAALFLTSPANALGETLMMAQMLGLLPPCGRRGWSLVPSFGLHNPVIVVFES